MRERPAAPLSSSWTDASPLAMRVRTLPWSSRSSSRSSRLSSAHSARSCSTRSANQPVSGVRSCKREREALGRGDAGPGLLDRQQQAVDDDRLGLAAG